MKDLTSIFYKHYNDLMQITDAQALETEIFRILNDSKINEVDRKKVLRSIMGISNNLGKLQYYLTNSMLKYQGLGTLK